MTADLATGRPANEITSGPQLRTVRTASRYRCRQSTSARHPNHLGSRRATEQEQYRDDQIDHVDQIPNDSAAQTAPRFTRPLK